MIDARPLSPFEHLLLRDQRPGYPMCFFLHCDVAGDLDTARLRRALEEAAGRHPLLRSRVRDSWWRPTWRPADRDPVLVVIRSGESVAADGDPDSPWRPIDIRRESGIRMVAVETGPSSWRVVIQVQHSACDGLAGLEFLGDVWSLYHGAEPAAFRTPSRVVRRRATAAPDAEPPPAEAPPPEDASFGAAGGVAGETARFAGFLPAALARGPGAGPGDHVDAYRLPYVPRTLDADTTAAIKARATAAGVAVNDVIVAAVMRAVVEWNLRAGRTSRRLRVTMPASLKPAGTRAPACIDMGYAFLDRDADACRDVPALVASIGAASRWIQEHRAAGVFLDTLATIDRFPPAMRLVTRVPLPLASAVVSNVGNAGPRMKIGTPPEGVAGAPWAVRLIGVAGVPPVRPGTRLAVGVVFHDGRMALCVQSDARALGPAAAPLLADLVRDQVVACAAALEHDGGAGCRDNDGAGGDGADEFPR
jgi:hypothetical protein